MRCQSNMESFPHGNYGSVYHAGFPHASAAPPLAIHFPHAAAPPLAIYFCTNNGWAPYPCSQQPKEEVELDQKLVDKLEEDLKQKEEALRKSYEEKEELIEKLRAQAKMSTRAEVAELREEVRRQQHEVERRMEMVERLHTKHVMVDTEDLKQQEETLRRSQEENEKLWREIEKLRAEASSLSQPQAEMSTSAEVAELREQVRLYKDMESRMEKAEWLHTMGDTAFFPDDSARPPLLQAAVDAVKEATAICASDLFTYTKQHSVPYNLAYFGSSVDPMHTVEGPDDKRVPKMALQAFLCNLLFQDFEAPDSFIPGNTQPPPFERPELLKSQRLQAYKTFRYVEPADIIHGLQHTDPIQARCSVEFNLFLESKLDRFATQLRSVLVMSEDQDVHLLIKPFYTSFLRLATAVWLLHKLAFAFKPGSAEIFRVAQNSTFVAEYMESMVPLEPEDEEEEHVVGFMIVPGFTVRNSIIKSRVYLAF